MGDRMRIIGLESKTIIFEMGIDLEDIRIVKDGQEYYSLPLGISLIENRHTILAIMKEQLLV